MKVADVHGNISFKGVYNNKVFLKGLEFAADNGTLFAASTSLALSALVRPLSIMATPKTDKENKKYACIKSISSSLVGFIVMLGASIPIAKAVKNINLNPEKYLKPKTIKNLSDGVKPLIKSPAYMFATQLFKLGIGLMLAIPKSVMTYKLIPPMISKIKKQDESKKISFKGNPNVVTNKLSKMIAGIINLPSVQKFANKFKDTNISQHIMALTDVILTASFIKSVKYSNKIDDKRKKPLIYNSAVATGLSVAGGYGINSLLNKPTEKFIEKLVNANKNSPKLTKYIEGIKIAKPILILGVLYYAVIPVISTFVADRINAEKNNSVVKV